MTRHETEESSDVTTRGSERTARRLVLATNNVHKLRELRALAADLDVEILSLQDLGVQVHVVEDGRTFLANATKKALAVARATGLPALADDSGLEVYALGRRPGVHSARYAGPNATDQDRIDKLLRELEGVPPQRRTARFRCVTVLALPGSDEPVHVAEGVCYGRITEKPMGAGGFGYDPVFWHPRSEKTFAQMSPEEKNRVSHRARALRAMVAFLAEHLDLLEAPPESTTRPQGRSPGAADAAPGRLPGDA